MISMYDMNHEYNIYHLSLLPGRASVCDRMARNRCKKRGGSCVAVPFKKHCEELHGAEGKLINKACKSKNCQCCAPC